MLIRARQKNWSQRRNMKNKRVIMSQEQGLFQFFSLLLLGGWIPESCGQNSRREVVKVGEEKI